MTDGPAPFDPSTLHDPGGKVRLALPDGVIGGAAFSACGRYRRALSRDWTLAGQAPRTILFVGQNPSVAGVEVSDPTCHRELNFARSWGFTRYLKANVLDWRATVPKDVPHDPAIACTPENIAAILEMADESDCVVMAYGRLHRRFHPVVQQILAAIRQTGRPMFCLGLNNDGSPKHPLYLRQDTELKPFPNM